MELKGKVDNQKQLADAEVAYCADLLLLGGQEGPRKCLGEQVTQLFLEGASLFTSGAVPPQHTRQLWVEPANLSCTESSLRES